MFFGIFLYTANALVLVTSGHHFHARLRVALAPRGVRAPPRFLCSRTASGSQAKKIANDDSAVGSLSHEGYQLEQVVVLSRHNIRSPLSGGDSLLGKMTPHEWFQWTSNPSELSLRGGILETEEGRYFRQWLETEGLFPENYHPEDGAIRIYANSKQRTIATAKYFINRLHTSAEAYGRITEEYSLKEVA